MRTGIYVDAANISLNGGYAMRYDLLKSYCLRNHEAVRLNTYLVYDEERAAADKDYKEKNQGYFSILRSFGFKVIIKPVRKFYSEDGKLVTKANVDLDIAVDMLLQSQHLDKVFLLTGDGDFQRVVQAVQNMGVRVEVIAFENISRQLIYEADFFTSGYLIPNLIPMDNQASGDWGQLGKRVRGICYSLSDGFGFIRYMDLEYVNHQVFFHFSDLPPNHNVRLEGIYSFEMQQSERGSIARKLRFINQS